MREEAVLRPGRYADTVAARSILCYAAHRELGIRTVALAERLGVSQPTVSQSVQRGEQLVKRNNIRLFPEPVVIYQ
jgi:plasmid maintenance system antidote protein VapI